LAHISVIFQLGKNNAKHGIRVQGESGLTHNTATLLGMMNFSAQRGFRSEFTGIEVYCKGWIRTTGISEATDEEWLHLLSLYAVQGHEQSIECCADGKRQLRDDN